MSLAPVPAMVTSYNPDTEVCNLTIFPDSVSYVIRKQNVLAGNGYPGTYQEISALISIAVSSADGSGTTELVIGQTWQFQAVGTYSDVTTKDITSTVMWRSYDHTVATVDDTGMVTANGAGTVEIDAVGGTGTTGNVTGNLTITVVTRR